MRVLITGGTGYIGQYLCKCLKEHGYDVVITSRKNNKVVNGYENRYMELTDPSSIVDVCKNIDIVIHLANWDELLVKEHPEEAYIANSYATRLVYLDALKNSVRHFVFFSTFHVYGKNYGQISETTIVEPKTDYAMSHYFAELFLRQLSESGDCKVSIIRLTNGIGLPLEGVGKWYLAINDFCKTAYEKKQIIMKSNGLPVRDFVAIRDVAEAVAILISKCDEIDSKYEIYNLSSQDTYSIRDVANIVCEEYSKRYCSEICFMAPQVTESDIKMIKPLFVSSEKIRNLGWNNKISIQMVVNEIFDSLENII